MQFIEEKVYFGNWKKVFFINEKNKEKLKKVFSCFDFLVLSNLHNSTNNNEKSVGYRKKK